MRKIMVFLFGAILLLSACGSDNESDTDTEELEKKIRQKNKKIERLEDSLESEELEVTFLEEDIEELEEQEGNNDNGNNEAEETELDAGTFYFGEDVEPGRYVVTLNGSEKGNVRIKTEEDNLIDAVALGDGSGRSEKELAFEASEGDKIDTATTIKLEPK